MRDTTDTAKGVSLVREAARAIRSLEADAAKALDAGDTKTHRFKMMEKCEVLADLPELTEPYLKGDDEPTARLRRGIADFARRANMALDLESIFFMAALLYPEDYKDGEPNDLERFADRFE